MNIQKTTYLVITIAVLIIISAVGVARAENNEPVLYNVLPPDQSEILPPRDYQDVIVESYYDRSVGFVDFGVSDNTKPALYVFPIFPMSSLSSLPGDANLDGRVDLFDFAVLRGNFGMTDATWVFGDFDGDGIVGINDYLIFVANFGNYLPTNMRISEVSCEFAMTTNIPEPASIAIITFSGGFLIIDRCRRKKTT